MLDLTHIPEAPWWVVRADDKKRARLNCIHHLLGQMPYQEVEQPLIALPERERHEDYTRSPVAPELLQAKRLLDLLGMELLFSPDVPSVMHAEADLRLPPVRAARLQAIWWKLQKLAKQGRCADKFKPQHDELAAQPIRAGPAR